MGGINTNATPAIEEQTELIKQNNKSNQWMTIASLIISILALGVSIINAYTTSAGDKRWQDEQIRILKLIEQNTGRSLQR